MARIARSHMVVPGAPVHLVLRGNNRRRLFSRPLEYRFFLRQLAYVQRVIPMRLHACCLMANHVHLLVTPLNADALAAFVKRVSQRFAQFRNARTNGSGRLFEERYAAHRIRNEAHLAIVTAYIDLNPVRAGVVVDARRYLWSTFAMHVGASASPSIAEVTWAHSDWHARLGVCDEDRARAYAAFADECLARDRGVFAAQAWGGAHEAEHENATDTVRRPGGARAAGHRKK